MKPFTYEVADDLPSALAVLNNNGRTLKAGGIDLLDRMKERLELPGRVVSIGNIGSLRYIKEEGGAIRIGCLTTLADIGRSELLKQHFPALYESAGGAATPQVREQATLGGNLCQRPRCWYYRSIDFHCLKKGGGTCYAVEGENQYHAVIGGGPCHIVHPSNCAPPLLAADADLVIKNADGERPITAADFFRLPRESMYAENILQPGEVVTEAVIRSVPTRSASVELREKQSFDWPMAMASVARVDGRWRVCLGAVAPVPWLSKPAMDVLGTSDINPGLAAKAGEAAAGEAEPMSQNSYKVQLIKVAVKRALLAAAGVEDKS
jgi:xanthine dehydrogenase YagS FAD-binding subunit